jgi:hypothetical protein
MPARITYVGIASERVNFDDDPRHWIERGRIAAIETVRYNTPCPEVIDRGCYGTVQDFWQILAKGLLRKKMNWIYVRDLSRAMTLLHGWELIETGGIHYQAACLQDPPLWIRCVIAGRPALLTDSRNYGDDQPCEMHCSLSERSWCSNKRLGPREFWQWVAESELSQIRGFVEPVYMSIAGLGGCGWKPTISGLAWSLYRRHYIPETADLWDEERDAAGGG